MPLAVRLSFRETHHG
uniref:Uncharacterized protein n=1 Tax=Anguilla anguilla TaxID=7936 RepID=A0A0E9P5Z7_ANGAN